MTPPAYAFLSLLLASVLSASGALLIVGAEERLDDWQRYLTPLAAGVMLGAVFVHLLPRVAADYGFSRTTGLLAIGGVLGSYAVEEAVHGRYADREVEPFSVTLVVGDGIHNVVDGVVVATGYYVSVPVGVASTLAIVLHKLPKELGDFGALLEAGVDEWHAVGANVLANLGAFVGAAAVVLLSGVEGSLALLLPLAAGNFLYVAAADLLPELRDGDSGLVRIGGVAAGVAAMYAITLIR